jgi:hypothetical protein
MEIPIIFFSKEIAMVTLQLMTTRQLQLVKDKKIKDMNPPDGKDLLMFKCSQSHFISQ